MNKNMVETSFKYLPCGDGLFATAFADVIVYEGELSDDPDDFGGLTKYGITRSEGLTNDQIRNLTLEQAKAIYKRKYWDFCKCALMPAKVARQVFDWHVNSGRGITTLQFLIYSHPDGIFGSKTLNDLKYYIGKRGEDELAQRYAQYRQDTYRKFATVGNQAKFLEGWLNRNENLAAKLGLHVE